MKKLFGVLVAIFLTLFMTMRVSAIEIAQAGDTVLQEGSYDSLRLAAGNKVINKAEVDGLSLVAGNELNLEGSAPYGFYAGNIVLVNEKIEKDMFVAGNSITIGENAIIGRDAYIAGESVTIKTTIGRDLRMGAGSVNLSGATINGDAYITAGNIVVDANTVISGKLTYNEDAVVTGLELATVSEVEKTKVENLSVEYTFKTKLVDFLISSVAAFVVMIVVLYLVPRAKEKLDNTELTFGSIAKAIGLGLVTLLFVPVLALILLFSNVFSPLALITLATYAISLYLASLIVYYVVGNTIMNKLFKKDNMFLALICGILLVKLVVLIPYVGAIVALLVLLYGLGLIFRFIKSRGN